MRPHPRNAVIALAAAALGLLLTACSGTSSSGEPLTAAKVAEELERFDCTDVQSEREADEEGNPYSVVTCELGTSGGIAVNVVDTAEEFAGVRALACTDVIGNDDAADLQVAYGENWVGIAISSSGVGVNDLAETLGGTVGTLQEFCS